MMKNYSQDITNGIIISMIITLIVFVTVGNMFLMHQNNKARQKYNNCIDTVRIYYNYVEQTK